MRRSAVRCPPTPEGRPEVAGQGADIGAGGDLDLDVDIEHGYAVRLGLAGAQDLEAGDRDGTGRQGHVLAGADPGVGALPLDLDGAHRARHLLDLAGEAGHGSAQRLSAHPVGRGRGHDLALGVVGDGRLPQPDGGRVRLVAADQEGQQAGGLVDAEDQHPGRHRVEGAGVADPAGAAQPPGPADDVVAGPASRLVDDEQAVRRAHPPRPRRRPRRPRRPRPRASCTGRPRRRTAPQRQPPRPRRHARGPP